MKAKIKKIGEVFEYKGEWYQCVRSITCNECGFNNNGCTADRHITGDCSGRSDGASVIFKRLKKVGEPFSCNYYGNNRRIRMQEYHLYNLDDVTSDEKIPMYITNYKHKRIAIEIKQNKKDMKEKNNGNTPLNVLTDKYVNGNIGYDEFEKEVKALYSCKKESEPKLKPFDLEAAKAGKPVCTRDGRKARIICFDAKGIQPIIALITCGNEEKSVGYKNSGISRFDGIPDEIDLMMLPEKKEGWVNVYKDSVYDTKDEALSGRSESRGYINTIKISWS